jgi:hypothetical protein
LLFAGAAWRGDRIHAFACGVPSDPWPPEGTTARKMIANAWS